MTKNFTFGIAFIAAALILGGLFIQQQTSQKNPLDNAQPINPGAAKSTSTPVIQTPTPTQTQTAQNSSQSANIVTMTDGLQIQDIKVGDGQEAKTGNTVAVNYIGTLQDGTKFDSSYDRNQPFSTQIGVGQVIKGWDEGIPGMRVGGKRKLIIPAALGYGAQGAGAIPPNSILVFEVELLAVK